MGCDYDERAAEMRDAEERQLITRKMPKTKWKQVGVDILTHAGITIALIVGGGLCVKCGNIVQSPFLEKGGTLSCFIGFIYPLFPILGCGIDGLMKAAALSDIGVGMEPKPVSDNNAESFSKRLKDSKSSSKPA